jgi:hypothetical protein
MIIEDRLVMATLQLTSWLPSAFVASHVSTSLIISSAGALYLEEADADGTADTDFSVRFFEKEDPDDAGADAADADAARGAAALLRSRDAIALTYSASIAVFESCCSSLFSLSAFLVGYPWWLSLLIDDNAGLLV